ncbi:MAG: hypothetical protein R3325_12205, partial [Thermoanaerobaculia bacterium]|nr:hypothetical protein [Thermoanaerobaculia bacterium]
MSPGPRGRTLAAAGGLIALLATGLAAAAGDVDERLDVRLVTVPLLALDSDGEPVAGLERDQLELERDGEPIEIVALSPVAGAEATGPAGSFVLYLDSLFVEPGPLAAA